MGTLITSTERTETLADMLRRLGDIPPERVLMQPAPGTATEEDLITLLDGANKRICELIDGVLVEKPMGIREAILAGAILHFLWDYLEEHDLGVPAGADGPIRLRLGLVRIPDVCFISWKRLGGELGEAAISAVVPELAVEVLSKSNTRREIELKREEYFRAGVLLVWVIDPKTETAQVYTSPTKKKKDLGRDGVLDGGKILPGFKLPLRDLFARSRRRQR